ncbi:MAG: acyl-CoA dehydrogenase family protein [Sphingobium sp.]
MGDFEFNDMQQMLRDTLARFFEDRYGFEGRRQLLASDAFHLPAVWASLAQELGVLGASFPEEAGGLGGGAVDRMVVMEEIGRALVIEPYLSTAVLGGGVLSRAGGQAAADLVTGVIDGSVLIAFAHDEPASTLDQPAIATTARADGDGFVLDGVKRLVLDAPVATHLIVSATGADGHLLLFVVPVGTAGITRTDCRMIGGMGAAEIALDAVHVPAAARLDTGGDANALVAQVQDEGVAALCAEAVGILERLVADTVDYTKQRRQFGKAIAEFQVLQHMMVDMHVAAQEAKAITLTATLSLDAPAEERAAMVSAAKVRIGRACRSVSQVAVQLHGGMGMTDELAIGHLFRRALMIETQFGSTEEHRRRFERLVLDRAAA